jgi:acylphosphatase
VNANVARRVVVRGRVQGVFFRDATRREAQRRGITGWVRNRDDGTVEAHLEGDGEDVAVLVGWCRDGPRHADVDNVGVREVEPEGLAGFAIR